ncbi:unnamed protein product [marine sediment metagenome]|uniref:Uncharacterized protein n=1 Tax=marine sediment metagenome TaxID=412755 RepID=X1U8Q1_9ZZZZ
MTTEAHLQGLGPFEKQRFTLEHDGAMALFLLHEGELVARFSQVGATEASLQHECVLHLVTKHGGDGCLWERER